MDDAISNISEKINQLNSGFWLSSSVPNVKIQVLLDLLYKWSKNQFKTFKHKESQSEKQMGLYFFREELSVSPYDQQKHKKGEMGQNTQDFTHIATHCRVFIRQPNIFILEHSFLFSVFIPSCLSA